MSGLLLEFKANDIYKKGKIFIFCNIAWFNKHSRTGSNDVLDVAFQLADPFI